MNNNGHRIIVPGQPIPWTDEEIKLVKHRIDREAKRAAERIGAMSCIVIAFFEDGEYLHMQDGGSSPMPPEQLYKKLAAAFEMTDESSGKDVALS